MIKFEYITFVCPQDELEIRLNLEGKRGWRLHTCDAVLNMGPHGSGEMFAFVVMDQAFQEEEPEENHIPSDLASEGIAMKG